MPTSEQRWAPVPRAAEYLRERAGEPFTESTVRRWAADGRIRSRRIGARRMQIDLSSIDAMLEPVPSGSSRWLSEADERLAAETAAALLPLTDEQREKLSLLLQPGRGWHGAA